MKGQGTSTVLKVTKHGDSRHLLRTVTDVGVGSIAEFNANSKVLHATSVERWGIFPWCADQRLSLSKLVVNSLPNS